jgi:hypothetical protein
MRPELAHCHFGLSKLCRRTGDGAKAREHLTNATTQYREMDMGVLAGEGGGGARGRLIEAHSELGRPLRTLNRSTRGLVVLTAPAMGPDCGVTPRARQLLGSERARGSSTSCGRPRRVGRDIP